MSWFKPVTQKAFSEFSFNAPIISISNTAKTRILRVWKNEQYKTFLIKIFSKWDKRDISIVLSKEHILSLSNVLLKYLLEEIVMSSLKSKVDVVLDYFFRRTRTKYGAKYLHRTVILKILERGTVFASEVMREQNVSFPTALKVVHEMEREGLIIRGKGVGRLVPYRFSLDTEQIRGLVKNIESLKSIAK